jgi:hypothetical protein
LWIHWFKPRSASCEEIDEWLDDLFWKDENGENASPLKRAICENNA